jgi:hypothetical protein
MTTSAVQDAKARVPSRDYCELCGGSLRVHGDCIACTGFAPRYHYLVVAPETASSPELKDLLHEMAASNPKATFVLLVPALDPSHLLVWESGDPEAIARRKAEEAQRMLARVRVKVVRTVVGVGAVEQAIADELRAHPSAYDSVILCTLPPGASRWIELDAAVGQGADFGVPLYHVTGGAALR